MRNKKISPGLKRRNLVKAPKREFEHVLPIAIQAINQKLDEEITIQEVYICLEQNNERISYDYVKK